MSECIVNSGLNSFGSTGRPRNGLPSAAPSTRFLSSTDADRASACGGGSGLTGFCSLIFSSPPRLAWLGAGRGAPLVLIKLQRQQPYFVPDPNGTFFAEARSPRYSARVDKGEISVADSKTVAQYLPFLRRYARALTGNQSSGDAYVAAALEALVADPSVIAEEGG